MPKEPQDAAVAYPSDDKGRRARGQCQRTGRLPGRLWRGWRGLHPDGTFSVNGRTDFLSDNLNERQRERTAFGLASFHCSGGAFMTARP